MTDAPTSADPNDWTQIVATLAIVGDVIQARHAVEAVHGTPGEAAAIATLGEELTRLEEAYEALRAIHERNSKGA